jgi:type II secretory pathway pseudopilin PulG
MSLVDHYFQKSQLSNGSPLQKEMQQGFILLEALIAMSLILGVWMGMLQIYQGLALRQTKLQAEKVQLRKESDVFELSEHARSNQHGSVKHESTRVLDRSRAESSAPQPPLKNKRRFGS